MHESQDKPGVEERLDQVEAKLIESEHRLYAALRNFVHRNDWPKGDPRRRAAWMALFWVWFAPVTIAVGGGTATLAILIWQGVEISRQSTYLKNQNDLFTNQLEKMDTQIREAKEATREAERTHLIDVLWGVKEVGSFEKKNVPIASSRMREEAMLRFVEIENERFRAHRTTTETIIDLSGAALSRIYAPQLKFKNSLRVSFAEANLSGANLHGASLRGVNLRGANLRGANLRGVDLAGANLLSADLGEADLTGANLTQAELSWASLHLTRLGVAVLRDAKLVQANARGAVFVFADLNGATLDGADLSMAALSHADLRGAHLRRAILAGANLDEAKLSGVDLSEAELREAVVGSQTPAWLNTQKWYTKPTESYLAWRPQWRIHRRKSSTSRPSATTISKPAADQTPTIQGVEKAFERE